MDLEEFQQKIERIKELEKRLFFIEMRDHLESDDYVTILNINDEIKKLKEEVKENE